MNNDSNDTSKMGVWMFAIGFIFAIGLLVAFFSGMLEKRYNPNQDPFSLSTPSGVEVRLKQNRMGHYITAGEINGQAVTFLLDTGATNVSVGERFGQTLGLIPGRQYQVMTANGRVTVSQTNIRELKIGDITLYNVNAHLNPGMGSDKVLLGMSALKQLEWTQRGDTLTLKTM